MQMNTHIQKKVAEIRDWPLVTWWIKVTSPAPGSPASKRNPQWREEVTSLLFPIVILLVLLAIPNNFNNIPTLVILCVVACIDVGALFLKRAGLIYIAGTIVTITVEFGLCSAVLATGRFDTVNLSLFDLMVQSVIVAMAFFPPLTVFFIAFFNCFFIICALQFQPHTAALNQQLAQHFVTIATPSILLQIFVAGVSFIIIRALIKEIRRADSAEELAQLRQSEAELRKRQAEQAQQLEEGIQLILQALNTAAAKGDFSMRVPLAQENILWRVGYSINNLLARLQGFRQEKAELDKTRAVASRLTECLREGRAFPLNQWTGTSLDQLIIELNKQLNASPRLSDQALPRAASHPYR
jgi:hypothetical protein